MTSFNVIYDSFKRKIEDPDYLNFTPEQREEYLFGFLQDAIGMIQAENIQMTHNLSDIDLETKSFNETLDYSEIMVLSLYMVIAWYEPRINSLETTILMWGSKDERWADQKKFLEGLVTKQNLYRERARKYFLQNKVKNNTYLTGDDNAE